MHYLYTDGGARGNPGPSAIGAFLFDQNTQLVDFSGKYLGESTNNVAEYSALLEGLSIAKKNGVSELTCYLDSELAVKQLNGAYKVKNEGIQVLFNKVKTEVATMTSVEFVHVPRAANKFADKLVNTVLDARN